MIKDTLIREINKLKKQDFSEIDYLSGRKAYLQAISDIFEMLDTLEVKEVDLEEKATQLSQKYFPDEENIWARSNIEAHKCKSACVEMVEWFKAVQKGE